MQLQPQFGVLNGFDRCASSSPAENLRAQVCFNRILSFLMEAHDRFSGTIAKRAGLKEFRASGFSSTWPRGYCDANETLGNELVDVAENSKLVRTVCARLAR